METLDQAFRHALETITATRESPGPARLAIAYSGGLDSAVLLDLAQDYARKSGAALHAFHVHHGLSPNADAWLRHCADVCARLSVPFDAQHVQVQADGDGLEQAARSARYAALGKLCAQYSIDFLLTAHHADDQAETVLLQLLRGSGISGLAGMEAVNDAAALLECEHTRIGRPLLSVTRAQLETWARERGLCWVDDESNLDPRFARNRLRHAVLPRLAKAFPGYQERLGRAARHARSARELLDELAAQDLEVCALGAGLDLSRVRVLSEARIDNLLRYWFARQGVRMPSTAWLAELRKQMEYANDDAQVRVIHPDCEVWRYRGQLLLAPRRDECRLHSEPVRFRWKGEGDLAFPSFGGRLAFETGVSGIDPAWLSAQDLTLRHRTGGERLKLAVNRPGRDLKHHFQAAGVPPWKRRRLPLVWKNEDLLFVAGLGVNRALVPIFVENGVLLRWVEEG